jgi:hypothetical protein
VDDVDGARERDRAVERLLTESRQVRQDRRAGGVTDSCLDAETLAVWVDGGLSGAALEAARVHVADCARCQAVVGTLARISPVGPAAPAHVARAWNWTASLKWLVPLTAAAAAVALWVAVPGDKFDRPEQTGRPSAAEAPRQTAETKAPEPVQRDNQRSSSIAKNNDATQAPDAVAGQADTSVLKSEVGKDSAVRNDAPARLEAENLKEERAAAAPAASAPAAAPPAAAEKTGALARSAARVAPPATVAAALADVARIEIASPDPSVRWRIAASVVERTTNGGSTWEAAPTGIAAQLMAGAAPSASVCWLVGHGGVVLLTIDGRSWSRVAFPEMTDLSAVRAADARTASVATIDGRRFSTTDGGTTWVQSPR